ncbi:hypothetical protein FRC01_004865, partial [Tulasnella sp. 417]
MSTRDSTCVRVGSVGGMDLHRHRAKYGNWQFPPPPPSTLEYCLPMESLPPEILSEIFLHALPNPNPNLFDDIRAVDPSVLHVKLCLVCRGWNEIAVTTPA